MTNVSLCYTPDAPSSSMLMTTPSNPRGGPGIDGRVRDDGGLEDTPSVVADVPSSSMFIASNLRGGPTVPENKDAGSPAVPPPSPAAPSDGLVHAAGAAALVPRILSPPGGPAEVEQERPIVSPFEPPSKAKPPSESEATANTVALLQSAPSPGEDPLFRTTVLAEQEEESAKIAALDPKAGDYPEQVARIRGEILVPSSDRRGGPPPQGGFPPSGESPPNGGNSRPSASSPVGESSVGVAKRTTGVAKGGDDAVEQVEILPGGEQGSLVEGPVGDRGEAVGESKTVGEQLQNAEAAAATTSRGAVSTSASSVATGRGEALQGEVDAERSRISAPSSLLQVGQERKALHDLAPGVVSLRGASASPGRADVGIRIVRSSAVEGAGGGEHRTSSPETQNLMQMSESKIALGGRSLEPAEEQFWEEAEEEPAGESDAAAFVQIATNLSIERKPIEPRTESFPASLLQTGMERRSGRAKRGSPFFYHDRSSSSYGPRRASRAPRGDSLPPRVVPLGSHHHSSSYKWYNDDTSAFPGNNQHHETVLPEDYGDGDHGRSRSSRRTFRRKLAASEDDGAGGGLDSEDLDADYGGEGGASGGAPGGGGQKSDMEDMLVTMLKEIDKEDSADKKQADADKKKLLSDEEHNALLESRKARKNRKSRRGGHGTGGGGAKSHGGAARSKAKGWQDQFQYDEEDYLDSEPGDGQSVHASTNRRDWAHGKDVIQFSPVSCSWTGD